MNTAIKMKTLNLSLEDILGSAYTSQICKAKAFLEQKPVENYLQIARTKVDFYPDDLHKSLNDMIPFIGKQVIETGITAETTMTGSSTDSFTESFKSEKTPLSSKGFYRLTESGQIQAITKSEHYHAPLGHCFPGYKLLSYAQELGISNIAHNNTRGFITRLLEEKLVLLANGKFDEGTKGFEAIKKNNDPRSMKKVINLQTGSLAVEAAVKMMLARFYVSDPGMNQIPKYQGKIPVFIVIRDFEGGKQANYHGTTVLTQTLRDLWPGLYKKFEQAEAYLVKSIDINDISTFTDIINQYDTGKYKVAGFLHELVLMNYGGFKISKQYLQDIYKICRKHDIPTLVDEIQSCLWAPDLFLFREYELQPDFVSVGKGFPGGQYAASKIVLTAEMDNLNQFGALVTNGQEELASLAYLITITFAYENRSITKEIGDYYFKSLQNLAAKFQKIIKKIEGDRHLASIVFESAEMADFFARQVTSKGYDISAQTYKADCPPAALTKIPLISTKELIDAFIGCMGSVLKEQK